MDVDAGAVEEKARAGDRPAGGELEEQRQSLVEALSRAAYDSFPDEVKLDVMVRLHLDEEKLRDKPMLVECIISISIARAYPSIDYEASEPAFAAAVAKLKEILAAERESVFPNPFRSQLKKGLVSAFQTPFKGDAHAKFRDYLCRCCRAADRSIDLFPYLTLMQSAGFGKSRLLYELAKSSAAARPGIDGAQGQKSNELDSDVDIRVLYISARDTMEPMGFPTSTPELTKWFFDSLTDMTARLVTAFEYANAYWDDVGADWSRLFTDPKADAEIRDALQKATTTNQQQSKRPRRDGSVWTTRSIRLLLLAVDDARSLVERADIGCNGPRFFPRFQKALKDAGDKINNTHGGIIFGVLVNAHAQIRDLIPLGEWNPSARKTTPLNVLFQPFVLTQTMDVNVNGALLGAGTSRGNASFDYKSIVLEKDEAAVWTSLVSMGRPLWKSCVQEIDGIADQQEFVLNLAACKLLHTAPIHRASSYSDKHLGGVTALFCRLGLRPRARSGMTSRMVTDYMATLAFVAHTFDAHVCMFASEPVLAFGATRLWYQLDSLALTSFMLPQLKVLLRDGVIDAWAMGEIVARTSLLLAMDSTTVQSWPTYGTDKSTFRFVGQFCSVKQFLDQLVGDVSELRNGIDGVAVTADQQTDFDSWMSAWDEWKVGFSQFVELRAQPTEKTLWFLLGRRAAGVLPRNQGGANVMIPIFRDDGAVSFMLVRVVNIVGPDGRGFPASASSNLAASSVFAAGHSLPKTPLRGMIRVVMTLGTPKALSKSIAPSSSEFAAQNDQPQTTCDAKPGEKSTPTKQLHDKSGFILIDSSDPDADSYTLVVRGAAEALEEFSNWSWWDPMEQVRSDLIDRAKVMQPSGHAVDADWEAITRHTLAHGDGVASNIAVENE